MNIHEYSIDLKWSQYNSVYMSYVTSRHDPAREADGTARLDDSISQPIRFLEMTFVLLKVNPVHFLHRDSISIHYKSLDSCWLPVFVWEACPDSF
jgi:hypothetical protein